MRRGGRYHMFMGISWPFYQAFVLMSGSVILQSNVIVENSLWGLLRHL